MLKRLFALSSSGSPAAPVARDLEARGSDETTTVAGGPVKLSAVAHGNNGNGSGSTPGKSPSFDEIYRKAAIKPPQLAYGILKAAEMVNSSHLAGMSPEDRRRALLMALEAAGANVEDVLQDAVVRQRALNDCEEAEQARLKQFEEAKAQEIRNIQEELEGLTNEYLGRIQASRDEVAQEQNHFRAWQKRKQQEVERITAAAAFCVPQASTAGDGGLTSVLERATASRR